MSIRNYNFLAGLATTKPLIFYGVLVLLVLPILHNLAAALACFISCFGFLCLLAWCSTLWILHALAAALVFWGETPIMGREPLGLPPSGRVTPTSGPPSTPPQWYFG
uniref:Uncharacterized protein n=1 Tax=Dunaliella tertiolecta TaxID=3047 RepID=A0A7S3VIJ5_DUNTE